MPKLPSIEKLRNIVYVYDTARNNLAYMLDIHSAFMDECDEDDEDLNTLEKIEDMIERFDMMKPLVPCREKWVNSMILRLRYMRDQKEELESMHLKPDPSNFRKKIDGTPFRPLHSVALRCWARATSLEAFRTSFEKEANAWLDSAFAEDGDRLSEFHLTVVEWKEGKNAILKLEF